MKKFLTVLALPLVVLLTACGPNNPLIGTWESEPMMGMTSTIEFKSGSMTSSNSIAGSGNSNEIKVAEYKIEKDKVAVVLEQEGSKATFTYNIVDDDTIMQDLGMIKQRFHRKK